ncbi:MAG: septum formation initiator [Flavipsychrobacter sp.]|nr:septum formation initiator [Flavipsychrobacter sp.]
MKKVVKVLTNKYFLVTFGFVCWTVFFDQNDWMSLKQRQKELNAVKDNIAYLNTEIDRMNAEREGLMSDPHKLEKYAREHYRMKHEGEDVYVIEQSTAEPQPAPAAQK